MKRARGKNTSRGYDEIDVPDIVQKNYERHTTGTTKRTSSQVKKRPQKTVSSPKTTTQTRRISTKKKKKKKSKILLFAILLFLVAFLVMMGRSWGGDGESGALIPVDMDKGKLNVLLLGVDKEGLRTDAMMLVSYDLKETKAEILSIPRDTQIKVTDRSVTRKINEVHAMHDKNNKLLGPMGSIKAVTALTNVPIHYYIEFSFDAIDELADALGPIEFDVPDIEGNGRGMNYEDPVQDLYIHLKPGLQKLRGNQVQQFLRYRKSSNGTFDGSDLSRVKRQQEFIKAVVDQKVNVGLIAKAPNIFSKIKKNIKTNFSAGDIIKYVKYLKGLKSENINTHQLPGESKNTGRGWYFICDFDGIEELITNTFGYEVDTLTNKITVNDIDGTKNILSSVKINKNEKEEESEPPVNDEVEENTPEPAPEPDPEEDDYNYEDDYSHSDETEETPVTPSEDTDTPEVSDTPEVEVIPDEPVEDEFYSEDEVITLE